jgi:enoyl-CoA hydratase/carnithine racemase
MVAAELGELLLDIEIAPQRVRAEQAPEARRCGLVQEVVPAGAQLERATELARKIQLQLAIWMARGRAG